MRHIIVYVAILLSLSIAHSANAQPAEKYYFLKITSVEDGQAYTPGAQCKVVGVLQLPKGTEGVKQVFAFARLYRPAMDGGSFVIANEAVLKLRPTERANVFEFEGGLTLPKAERRYLLQVNCLDFRLKKYPQNFVATQSLFIDIKTRGAGKGHTVTIETPLKDTAYSTSSNVSTSGSSTEASVEKIRLRIVRDSTILQEETVNVSNGSWTGTLQAPSGGWGKGDAELQAQGLDKDGSPVGGELGRVNITFKDGPCDCTESHSTSRETAFQHAKLGLDFFSRRPGQSLTTKRLLL